MFINIAKTLTEYYLFRTLYKIYSVECVIVKNWIFFLCILPLWIIHGIFKKFCVIWRADRGCCFRAWFSDRPVTQFISFCGRFLAEHRMTDKAADVAGKHRNPPRTFFCSGRVVKNISERCIRFLYTVTITQTARYRADSICPFAQSNRRGRHVRWFHRAPIP